MICEHCGNYHKNFKRPTFCVCDNKSDDLISESVIKRKLEEIYKNSIISEIEYDYKQFTLDIIEEFELKEVPLSQDLSILLDGNVDYSSEKYSYHGGPYDRGAADKWYHRARVPHIWPDGTGKGTQILEKDMTDDQIAAYHKGYNDQDANGGQKEW